MISGEDLKARVIEAVRRAPSLASLEIAQIKTPPFSAQRIPEKTKVEINIAGDLRGGRMPVEVVFTSKSRVLRKLRVFVEVDLYMKGWALRSTAAAGTALTLDDIIEVKRSSREFQRDAIRDPEQVLGARLRRTVSALVPLREGWLLIPPLVKRGSIVELSFSRGGISLSV
jgi:flagella basal body P-ring formation protein FlgA